MSQHEASSFFKRNVLEKSESRFFVIQGITKNYKILVVYLYIQRGHLKMRCPLDILLILILFYFSAACTASLGTISSLKT